MHVPGVNVDTTVERRRHHKRVVLPTITEPTQARTRAPGHIVSLSARARVCVN